MAWVGAVLVLFLSGSRNQVFRTMCRAIKQVEGTYTFVLFFLSDCKIFHVLCERIKIRFKVFYSEIHFPVLIPGFTCRVYLSRVIDPL